MSSVFSKIIAGEIPGRFIHRDEQVVAFLDIAPQTYGHTLVVPVAEVDRWTDLPADTWAQVATVAQAVGQAQVKVLGAPRAGQAIMGFDVPHAHVHVFPVASMADFSWNPTTEPDQARMDEIQAKLSAAVAEILAAN